MTDNKLTDNEIIKALECCIKSSHFGECFDNKCPLVSEKGCEVGKETLYPYVLDLINRLQAENERLTIRLRKAEHQLDDAMKMYNIIKAEAYKEFAERLKEIAISRYDAFDEQEYPFVRLTDLDNLLKKLVGEDNE